MGKLAAHVAPFSRFVLVGALTAAAYFGVFALLYDLNDVRYELAISSGYACGVAFHFFANRNLTFKSASGSMSKQLAKYAVVVCVNYVVTLFVARFIVESLGLSPYLGVIAAVAATTLVGYALFAGWVFARQDSETVAR